MVLGSDVALVCAAVNDRLIDSSVTIREFDSLAANSKGKQLITQTYTENRPISSLHSSLEVRIAQVLR